METIIAVECSEKSLAKAVYITLTHTFLQPSVDFPAEWYLQAFFFVMPVVGIIILAQGLTDFSVMLFNRRARGKEWEDDFASSLQDQFGFHAMSATSMAAPLFAAIAAHVDVTPPINIEGKPHILAELQVSSRSRICGMTVNALEEMYRVSVILLCHNGERIFHPAGKELIEQGYTIAVFGEPENINLLLHERTR